MKGFHTSKPKQIKCMDCKVEIERLSPNHKRCKDCAYKMVKKRATEHQKTLDPQKLRDYAKEWYQRNPHREKLKRYNHWKSKN